MAEEDTVKAMMDELIKALSAKNIIGEPMEMEDKLIIPITKIGMGFGTGVGQRGGEAGGRPGAAGGGVGVFPVAVMLVFKGVSGPDGVKVVPLTAPSPLAEPMTSIVHSVVELLASRKPRQEKSSAHTASAGHTSLASHSSSIEIE